MSNKIKLTKDNFRNKNDFILVIKRNEPVEQEEPVSMLKIERGAKRLSFCMVAEVKENNLLLVHESALIKLVGLPDIFDLSEIIKDGEELFMIKKSDIYLEI